MNKLQLGTLALLVGLAGIAQAGTIWDGGGGNTNINTATNWDSDALPTLTGGTSTLTFGTGGSTATINTNVDVAGIVFNRDAAFTIADGGVSTLTIRTGGINAASPTATPRTYAINETSVILNGNQTWTVDNTNAATTLTTSALTVISGAFGITKDGGGTLSLNGQSTHSGATAINAGVLETGFEALGGTALLTVNSGGTFRVAGARPLGKAATPGTPQVIVKNGGTVFINNNVANSRLDLTTLDLTGSSVTGAVNAGVFSGLAGAGTSGFTVNVYAHATPSSINTVRVQGNSGATGTGNITFNTDSGAQLNVSSDIFHGAQGVTTTVLKTGSGTAVLSGNNSYGGTTTVSDGILKAGIATNSLSGPTAGAFGSGGNAMTVTSPGTVDLAGFNSAVGLLSGSGTVDNTTASPLLFIVGNATGSSTFSGVIQETGGGAISLQKFAGTTITLSGTANTFTGLLAVNNGTLIVNSLGDSGAGANGSGTIYMANTSNTATLQYLGGGTTITRSIAINSASAPNYSAGSGGGAVLDSSGTGALVINAGVTGSSFPGTNSKTLTLQGSNNGTIGGTIADGTVGTNAVSVAKAGAGIWTLSGVNTYTGTTSVSAGTLLVNGNHTSAGAYSITGTGILGGVGTITTVSNAGISFAAGTKLAPGTSPGTLTADLGTGTANISAAINLVNSQSMLFDLDTTTTSDRLRLSNASSTLAIGTGLLEFDDFVFTTSGLFGPGIYTLFDTGNSISGTLGTSLSGTVGGYAATIEFRNGTQDIVLNVVPEPGTFALLLFGGVFMWFMRKNRS